MKDETSNNASSHISPFNSPKRKLGYAAQLATLEQEVVSQQSHCRCNMSVKEGTINATPTVIPLNDLSSVAVNDIESNHKSRSQWREDTEIKHKTVEQMLTPAIQFDSKVTMHTKIQKHIELNSLPRNRIGSSPPPQDVDSFILRKLKEVFHPTASINHSVSQNRPREDTDIHESPRKNSRLDDLESAENANPNNEDTPAKPHRFDDLLEYDVLDDSHVELSVAVHVDDDRNHADLPAAVEYDPNSKMYLFHKRRFFLMLYLMLFGAVNGAVGACAGFVLIINHNHVTPADMSTMRSIRIREYVQRFVATEQLDDVTSPYRQALDWIVFRDQNAWTPDHVNFGQRYFVAYLYFATSTIRPWEMGCAPMSSINRTTTPTRHDHGCSYSRMTGTVDDESGETERAPVSAFRWLSEYDVCEWAGIFCDAAMQVQGIDLGGFGLTGTFPEGIFQFPYLEEIRMGYGNLQGPLPEYLASMKHLVHVDLQHNSFTGTIPGIWYNARSFQHIDISANRIDGTISTFISNWHDVKSLHIGDNLLHGSIPTEIGRMGNLYEVSMHTNQLNGTIPTIIGQLSELWVFSLFQNRLTGTIPTNVGQLVKLADVRLSHNSLEGSIPHEFWNMISLHRAELNDNNLNGTVSRRVGQLDRLEFLHLHNNQFSGAIPPTLGASNPWLLQVSAEGNHFTGRMPTSMCAMVQMGQIEMLSADCDAPGENGGLEPEISCPHECCTSCCTPDGKTCRKNNR